MVYRKSLWAGSDHEVEIWLEKSALAGVIYSVTAEYDGPLKRLLFARALTLNIVDHCFMSRAPP